MPIQKPTVELTPALPPSDMLAKLNGGSTMAEIQTRIQETVCAVIQTGKRGKVTIEFVIDAGDPIESEGRVIGQGVWVKTNVKATRPSRDEVIVHMCAAKDGKLSAIIDPTVFGATPAA